MFSHKKDLPYGVILHYKGGSVYNVWLFWWLNENSSGDKVLAEKDKILVPVL
ncbi:hypothetical protein Dhaf_1785 [Desulfitobacterium hafniense DCB-2]|uniref:Uncharacterized protein n=3 Tax=root TaxID=1 RepID=A0A098B7C4_DESHA|nr:hypothetical protein Dhaf_1785 [Desulfitobacterium hafniense DCB-2]CDX03756.1 Hypothetical protein DPCES_3870 [Desulfitobacterium hafniense]